MNKDLAQNTGRLLKKIQKIVDEARNKVYRTANTEMLRAYWTIGSEIVEEEQKGKSRADYGSALLEELATRLTDLYGKSFSSRNLRYMRQFYREFPKWNAVRSELSWTHYRILLKVEKVTARQFYPTARKTRSLKGRDIRAHFFYRLNNDISQYTSLSTRNCPENQWDKLTVGRTEMACRANRVSGRQQEPAGTREEVLPVASEKLLESISFT